MDKALDQPPAVDPASSRCPALLGSSAMARRARRAARAAAQSNATVLVIREPGGLGETVARAIHEASARAQSPFVWIECNDKPSASVATLAADPSDWFATASGGATAPVTVFLDPLEDLSPATQAGLAKSFAAGRLGTDESGVRILAGTRSDLRARISASAFRRDLFYHVAVVIVEVPSLRDRPEDIPDLLSGFLTDLCASSRRPVPRIPRRVVDLCQRYSWPGNLRELRCVAAGLLASSEGSRLKVAALPCEVQHPTVQRQRDLSFRLPAEGVDLKELERHLIRQALEHQRGNRTRAAGMLGLSRQALLYRMQKHGIR